MAKISKKNLESWIRILTQMLKMWLNMSFILASRFV